MPLAMFLRHVEVLRQHLGLKLCNQPLVHRLKGVQFLKRLRIMRPHKRDKDPFGCKVFYSVSGNGYSNSLSSIVLMSAKTKGFFKIACFCQGVASAPSPDPVTNAKGTCNRSKTSAIG